MKKVILCLMAIFIILGGCGSPLEIKSSEGTAGSSTPVAESSTVAPAEESPEAGVTPQAEESPEATEALQVQETPESTMTPHPDSWGSMNAKVSMFDIDNAGFSDVIGIFGEPDEYIWGKDKFDKDSLPPHYITVYDDGFSICMKDDSVVELRFEEDPLFVYSGALSIGSTSDEVFELLGEPSEIVENQENTYQEGVFYKDISGNKGFHYFEPAGHPLRLFFMNDKVTALYLTRSDYPNTPESKSPTVTATPVEFVDEYDDIRKLNVTRVDFTGKDNLIKTLWFNADNEWPQSATDLVEGNPARLIIDAMNPGLGVREIHKQGITGKGVKVAIIDQPMYIDHPEFDGKIVAYKDFETGSADSMHGPAVTSLLVGENTGTAPGAEVYFAAAPSWLKDASYYAKALDWIVEENEKLPEGDKIRVVSVSAAPSGIGSPFTTNNDMWDEAVNRAETQGILVLDCTSDHGFISSCYYDIEDPDNIAKCRPGFPGMTYGNSPDDDRIFAPTSPRTTAEEPDGHRFSFQYTGRGGLSWAIPYCAGVLAMGWQVRPDLTGDEMKQILLDTAYISDGHRIINPPAFIEKLNSLGQ